MVAKNTGYSGFDYGVVIGPDGESTDKISCFPSNANRCIVIRSPKPIGLGGFATMARQTSFHDNELAELTEQMNKSINRVMDVESRREGRALHILITDTGPMFAWLDQHIVDDDGT